MPRTWLSYIGSAYGILTHAGFWAGTVPELACITGLAFQFIVHKNLCPSSVTVYDWDRIHWSAMDKIGVYSDHIAMFLYPGMNTGKPLLEDAHNRIRESLNAGTGVLTWAPTPILEFGIITGYNDEQKIYHVIDCTNENPDPLLFENLGRSRIPFLYIQRFLSAIDVDKQKMYQDTLLSALQRWNTPHSNKLYAQGEKAYDNLIASLTHKTYDSFGLTYAVNVYADTKKMIAEFLRTVQKSDVFPKLDDIVTRCKKVSEHFSEMAKALPFVGPDQSHIDETKIPGIIQHAKESQKLETEAMKQIANIIEG